jgi:hypothetical protein
MTLELAWFIAYLTWLYEFFKHKRVPRAPGVVTFTFLRKNNMVTLSFGIALPVTLPTDKVTKRTLTYATTPAGAAGPNPLVTTVVTDGQAFSFAENDSVAAFLVDSNVNGDSAPGPTTTMLMTEPTPTGPPATPGAVSWNFLGVVAGP